MYIFIVAKGFFNEENKILYGINEGEQGKQNKEVKMKRKGKRGAKDTKKAVKLSFLSEKDPLLIVSYKIFHSKTNLRIIKIKLNIRNFSIGFSLWI